MIFQHDEEITFLNDENLQKHANYSYVSDEDLITESNLTGKNGK